MNARLLKIVGFVLLGFVLAVASGWLWGATGRWQSARQLAAAQQRLRLTDARSRILGGRVDLYSLNFGAAAQNFDAARGILAQVLQEIERADSSDARIGDLKTAVTELDSAVRLAGTMRKDAHRPADRAAQAVSAAAHARQ